MYALVPSLDCLPEPTREWWDQRGRDRGRGRREREDEGRRAEGGRVYLVLLLRQLLDLPAVLDQQIVHLLHLGHHTVDLADHRFAEEQISRVAKLAIQICNVVTPVSQNLLIRVCNDAQL